MDAMTRQPAAVNPHHRLVLQGIRAAEPGRGPIAQRPEHLGTQRHWHGLTNAQRRQILLDFCAAHKDLRYDEWQALIDALYHGESYEERCAPQTLFRKFPRYRRRLPLAQLDGWLGQLNGWAEVDSTCQTVFSAQDMLADWAGWQRFLSALAADANINKRRAALVLLTAPLSQSSDPRFLELALQLIDALKHEKDKRITKAISWLLRKGTRHHPQAVAAFLDARGTALPAVARRETRRKLLTGKK